MKSAPAITEQQALEALLPAGIGEQQRESPVKRLVALTGCAEKQALRKIEKLVDRGYADYGVSAVYAWRTSEGDGRLRELRAGGEGRG